MIKLEHFDHLGTIRFVTCKCYRGYGWLTEQDVPQTFIKCLDAIRAQDGIGVLGYVIMPEHIHLVLYSPDTITLADTIERLKEQITRDVLSLWKNRDVAIPAELCNEDPESPPEYHLWQPGCDDHNCRGGQSVSEKIQHCHTNPVRRGLVREPGDWPWSSYGWYQGERDVPLRIDTIPPG